MSFNQPIVYSHDDCNMGCNVELRNSKNFHLNNRITPIFFKHYPIKIKVILLKYIFSKFMQDFTIVSSYYYFKFIQRIG